MSTTSVNQKIIKDPFACGFSFEREVVRTHRRIEMIRYVNSRQRGIVELLDDGGCFPLTKRDDGRMVERQLFCLTFQVILSKE